jgi:hypothetical protein
MDMDLTESPLGLSRKPDELESPAWHKEVLDECRRRADAGEEQFTDWEVAKEDLRNRAEGPR